MNSEEKIKLIGRVIHREKGNRKVERERKQKGREREREETERWREKGLCRVGKVWQMEIFLNCILAMPRGGRTNLNIQPYEYIFLNIVCKHTVQTYFKYILFLQVMVFLFTFLHSTN